MPAVLAIKTQVRNAILQILKGIPFYTQVGDQPVTIQPSAIVYHKTRSQISRPDQIENQRDDMPGLLLSTPLRTVIHPEEWTNERDLWRYHFLVQLIDRDLWSDSDRINSWEKWIEQIMSTFMFNCLDSLSLPTVTWHITTATGVSDIDEKFWVRHGSFIEGVEIEVRCSQPRGTIA